MAELNFVKDVPNEYSCMICAKLLNEPHLTDCCGQHFCQVCLERWFERQGRKICPHCRSERFTHILYIPLKRKIDLLQVYCTYKKNGCEEITTVGQLNSHTDKCGFAVVACTQNCGEIGLRKDLEQHRYYVCLKRMTRCNYCSLIDHFDVITGQHTAVCLEYPVQCPKRCTQGAQMKRKDLPQHATECPLESVDCDFREVGCDAFILRKDLNSHLESNTQLHLRKMMAFYREENMKLKEECKCLSSQVQRLMLNLQFAEPSPPLWSSSQRWLSSQQWSSPQQWPSQQRWSSPQQW